MSEVKTSTTETRRPDGAALVIALVLGGLAALIFWDVNRLGDVVGYSPVGPATVPQWIAFGLVGLAIWTAIAAFRRDFPEREHQEIAPVAWIIGGLAGQMLLLPTLGFSIATGVLFAATARAFGKRQLWFSLPIGIAICLAVWLIFALLLQLSLPAGPLERLFL
ncbi:MAG: tripartite tricarboxylate transporter TctB family protein [Arenimonas sp.]|nr:tripartite tricarboxylate transporter TctB family protein [Rhizobium sp.]MBW8444502.1 tripartite tricarboxylate transporter TctB family protein [Arenimonas sp.]